MNRIPFLHTLFFASALLLACGCSSPEQPDVPDVPDTSVPLSISVSTCTGTPISRSIVSATGTGVGQVDHIGVFLAAEDGYSSYADAAISSAVFNLTSTSPDWTASRPVNLQSKTASLYAWYPVKDKDGNLQLATTADKDKATRTIPIEVSATQTFDGASATACSQADYLYGLDANKTADVTPAVIKVNNATGNTSPTIYLYHALSQVVFTIEYKATRLPDAEYDYVKSISLSGGSFRAGTGTMQLNDGTLAFTDASNATLKFSATKDPQLPGNTGNPVAVAYGLVAPGTPGSNSAPVTVNLVLGQKDDPTNDRTLSATTTTWFSTPWEPGKIYTYHLLLDKNDLTFESVGIGDWTPQDKGETPMPPELGTRLTILAEIAGGESTTPATRDVTSPSDPNANVYDRSTFITGDKINVTCSRDGKAIAFAGYVLNESEWTATETGKGLGFLPAITCRAEFPVGYSSIAQDQSTPNAFLQSNLLRTPEVKVESATVSFTGNNVFTHQNARLTLKFTGTNTLPEFSQLNVVGTGLRGGTTSESITLLRPVENEYTWCAVISPRSEKTTINVTVTDKNGVTYKATLSLEKVEGNNHYTFTLKLQNNILVPVGGEITDWDPEVRYTGEFDKNTTK